MDTPIYNTLRDIYRYDGGWAFEDHGLGWRPWSDAWDALCGAVTHRADEEAMQLAKDTLRAMLRARI